MASWESGSSQQEESKRSQLGGEFESGCMGKLRQRPLAQAVGQGTWWGSTTLHHHQVLSAANVPDRTPHPFQQAEPPCGQTTVPGG